MKKYISKVTCHCIINETTNLSFLEPALIAKSNIILDVKPWDDETGKCWSTVAYVHVKFK